MAVPESFRWSDVLRQEVFNVREALVSPTRMNTSVWLPMPLRTLSERVDGCDVRKSVKIGIPRIYHLYAMFPH